MKRLFLLLVVGICWQLGVLGSQAGTLSGVVVAQPAASIVSGEAGKYDSRKLKFAEKVDYASLRNFVVYVQGRIDGASTPNGSGGERPVYRITQKGATFLPKVLPILVGSTVEWPNEDDIFHNVFSISAPKEFDLGLYRKPEVKRVQFDQPGRVDIFCSIHSTMNCTILVLENPFFALTDDKGHYSISNVPPGNHQLRAWHERLPSQRRNITLKALENLKVDFVLGPGAPASP